MKYAGEIREKAGSVGGWQALFRNVSKGRFLNLGTEEAPQVSPRRLPDGASGLNPGHFASSQADVEVPLAHLHQRRVDHTETWSPDYPQLSVLGEHIRLRYLQLAV